MLYWKEMINDLAKILTWFCSTCFQVYMTKLQMFCVCVSLLSHDRYQYDSLILSSDTGGLPELSPMHKQPVSWNFLLQS